MKRVKKLLLVASVLMFASSVGMYVINANAKATAQTGREFCVYLSDDFEGSRGVRSTDNSGGGSPFNATPFWSENDAEWLLTSESTEVISGNQSLKIPLKFAGSKVAAGFKGGVALPDVIPNGQVIGVSFKVKMVNTANITFVYNWGDAWHGDLVINSDATYTVNIPDMQSNSLEITKTNDVISVSLGIILYSSNGKLNIFAAPETDKQIDGGDGTAYIVLDDYLITEEHVAKEEYFKNVFSSTFDNANDTDTPPSNADKLFQVFGFDKGLVNEFSYIDSEIGLGKALKLISPVADWTNTLNLYSAGYSLENYAHYKYSVVMKTDNMYKLSIKLYGNNALQKEVFFDTTYYLRNATAETNWIDNNKSVNDYMNFELLANGYVRVSFDFYTENWNDMYIRWDNQFVSTNGNLIIDEIKIDKQFFEPIVSESVKNFNPIKNDDLAFGVNMNIGELSNVKLDINGELSDMTQDVDYTYENEILTVKNTFLKAKNLTVEDVCKIKITNVFYGTSTAYAEAEFNIIDSKPVFDGNANYDKAAPSDIILNVNLQNESITAFKFGQTDIDYNYLDGKMTVTNAVITVLNFVYGDNVLTLTTSGGTADVILNYKATPSINASDYDKATNNDFSFTIDTISEAITELKLNDTVLTPSDYTINGNTITIVKSNLTVGTATITLTTAGGFIENSVNISDTTVELSSEDLEYQRGTNEEITVEISAKGKAVLSVKLNNIVLTENDMILGSSSVTVLNTKLSALSAGEYQLEITTESSSDSLIIKVKAKAPILSGDTTKTATLGSIADVAYSLDTDGQSVTVKTGGAEISSDKYTFESNTLTFKKSYIETLTGTESGKEYVYNLSTSSGEVSVTLKIKSAPVVVVEEPKASGCGSNFDGNIFSLFILAIVSIVLLFVKTKKTKRNQI